MQMSLNRRGYLTVEVILASVVAFAIAFFLMEITIKLVNTTDDAYVDTEVLTDKALIIKNIKEKIENDINSEECGGIYSVTALNNNTRCIIEFCGCKKSIIIDNNTIKYETYNNNIIQNPDYSKTIDNSVDSLHIYYSSELMPIGYKLFKITGNNKFSNNNFEANIIVYNDKACDG